MSTSITSPQIIHAYEHHWTGTPGKSESTYTRDGIVLRRNISDNPGFEVDTSSWLATGTTTTSYAFTGATDASPSTMSVNGTVKRTNLHIDPGPRNASTWTVSVTGPTDYSVVSSAGSGGPGGGTSQLQVQFGKNADVTAWSLASRGKIAVTANTAYTFSLYAGHAWSGSNSKIGVEWKNSSGTSLGFSYSDPINNVSTGSYRHILNANAPTGATTADLLYIPGGTMPPRQGTGFTGMTLGSVMATTSSLPGDYFDGRTQPYTTGSTIGRSDATAHSGGWSGQISFRYPGNFDGVAQYLLDLPEESDWVVSLWLNTPDPIPAGISVQVNAGDDITTVPLNAGTVGWQRVVVPVHIPTAKTSLSVAVRATKSIKDWFYVYIDDVLIETGSAEQEYFDGSTENTYEFETVQPMVVDGWTETAQSRNVVNAIIGGGVDVTPQQADLRSGSFRAVFDNEEDASRAFRMHREPVTFTISDDDRPSIGMDYVLNGSVTRELDDESREFWVVTVEYQEVD